MGNPVSNVDVVRALYGCWERGDIAGSAGLFAPDFEFARVGADLGILAGEWRGVDEAWGAIREWMSSWDDIQVHVDEVFELDDGRVVSFDRQTGRGASSGVEMEHETGWLFTLEAGRIVRAEGHWGRETLRRAAGLPA